LLPCVFIGHNRYNMIDRIEKYFNGEMNFSERLVFLKDMQYTPELKAMFIEYKNMFGLFAIACEGEDDEEKSRESYSRFVRMERRRKTIRFVTKLAGYAASVLILVFSTYQYVIYEQRRSAPEVAVQMNKLFIPAGQRVNVTLQDGTDVWLNSNSTLTYPSKFGDVRQVEIEGEGFFTVAKDPERPFVVSARGVDIKALGTQFNVRNYKQEPSICASLLEGEVKVYFANVESKSVTLTANQEVRIEGRMMILDTIRHSDYFLWKEGIYSFQNELLNHLLEKLECYFDTKIIVKDPSIYGWEYTGKFRQRDGVEGILNVIRKRHKFIIEKDEENNTFTLTPGKITHY